MSFPWLLPAVKGQTAARATGNQLQTDWCIEEANRHLTEVKTMLGVIS